MQNLHFLILVAAGIIITALGIPLALGKIKRNIFYGYRITIAVMENDKIWKEVNALGGKHLIIIGTITTTLSLIATIIAKNEEILKIFATIIASALIIGFTYSIIKTVKLSKKLSKTSNTKSQTKKQSNRNP